MAMSSYRQGGAMARAKQAKITKQMTVSQLEAAFPDEEACCAYLVGKRWPDGVCCARCGHEKVADASHYKPFYWQCRNCASHGYRFSVTGGTGFENKEYAPHDMVPRDTPH